MEKRSLPGERPIPSSRRRWVFGMSACLLTAGLFAAPGCQWKGDFPTFEEPTTQPDVAWSTAPVALRIYPATRFMPEESRTVLEARLELLDALEDSAKGVGTVRFELRRSGTARRSPITDRLYAWDVSIRTLEEQKRYYDPVTRTYLFRLSMDDLTQVPSKVLLHVQFTPDTGNRIEAEATLSVPKGVGAE